MSANVQRPYLNPNGTVTMVGLDWCHCAPDKRRGPPGGVCWCGGAIPDEIELKMAEVILAIEKSKQLVNTGWTFS